MKKIIHSTLLKRAMSAAVLGPAAFLIILYGGLPFIVFVLFCASLALYEWIHLSLRTGRTFLFIALGLVYIPVSFWCCYWLRAEYPAFIALLFICMVWGSDIGAYFVGKTFRGPKMAKHISPNKTWAGFAGAIIVPAVLALIFFIYISGFQFSDVWVFNVAVISGVAIGVVGQAGDLIISVLKRQAHVKDSGYLIPGHGGLLDRIDSMLLSAPVFLFIVVKFSNAFIS